MKSNSRKRDRPGSVTRLVGKGGTAIVDARRLADADQTAADTAQTAADAAQTAVDAEQTAADAEQTAVEAEQTAFDTEQTAFETGSVAPGTDQTASDADQTASDADQTASDGDQTASDADQTASGTDQTSADTDQRASDRDQATADRDHAAESGRTEAAEDAYVVSRGERERTSVQRVGARLQRSGTARDRDGTAGNRDRTAVQRDGTSQARDANGSDPALGSLESDASLLAQLEEVRAQAAADRARAAADRARAAQDRLKAARERDRLEAELRSAHLDELTGAYRREMGRLALSNEIDRARRSNGRFVLAFIDVDRLKIVNDREGHAAGDRVLKSVVTAMRTRLRSFDPIVRHGGDEFVCGMTGTDLEEAERRFELIEAAIEADARVGISVGLAVLAIGDTVDDLTERADAAMLEVKARHHARSRRSA
jgi:diguanylate cyclase (GGDEF)-like protein